MTQISPECLSHNQGVHELGGGCRHIHRLSSSVSIQMVPCLSWPSSPEHPWVLGAVVGAWRGVGLWLPLWGWGCPIREGGFLAAVGTAATLAGGEGGHLRAPLNEGSLRFGRDAAEVTTTALPCTEAPRKGRCFLPRALGRILRKRQWGDNKRHWLVVRLRRYSELARISKAGVIHSAHHSSTVMFILRGGGGGETWPHYIRGSFFQWGQQGFHLLCSVVGRRVFPQHLKPILLKEEK